MTDIALERRLLREQGLEIRTREEYGARQSYTSDRDCDVPAEAFFLHIAVIDDPGDLLGTEDQVALNVERIGQTRFGSGWSYNAAAFNTGRLYEGQPLTRRGTHTVNTYGRATCPTHGGSVAAPWGTNGNLNITVRALVLPQDVDDPVTDEQIDAAARWAAAQIRSGLAKRTARWHGHRCVTAKGCPGDRAFSRIPELQRLTDHYVKNGLPNMDLTPKNLADIADAVATREIGKDLTIAKALRQAAKAATLEDRIVKRVAEAIDKATPDITGPVVSTAVLREAVKQALREGTEEE